MVEACNGIEQPDAAVKYLVGEGIVGRVVETGYPIVVPRASSEPALSPGVSDRPRPSTEELSIICVPIVLNRKAIGALAVDLKFRPDRDYGRTGKFFGVVASQLAQAVKVLRLIEEERRGFEEEISQLRQALRERHDFSEIIGRSAVMRAMLTHAAQVTGTDAPVLICGEAGAGKDLVARTIHYHSLRAQRPFVKLSCASMPDALIETELFGREKGAFSGATALKRGRLEAATGGTLLLDEIGDISLTMQARLLRVLREREFERPGGAEIIKVDVRILATTSVSLESAVAEGTFRGDLLDWITAFAIVVPPLRARKTDLPLLVDHLLNRVAREHGRVVKRVTAPAIDALMSYHWPGNVRELEDVLERTVLACDGEVIHAHHLPPTVQTAETSGTHVSLNDAVDALERELIQDALKTTRGNCSQGRAPAQDDGPRPQLQSQETRDQWPADWI